ncbi:acyl-CoA thioesterase II [Nakamurella antarctica]|uniref:Acyl-CoA thioesterase 2 n=1 Tax=Nakamurella antarctica TaxID=1902245 RepID=A0A3G8ZQB7_9ACTN|nr:acyl-CoA thioesterase II [Nakamurella antarctica]
MEYDTDGIPRGQAVLNGLVALLDLEKIEENIFRGHSPRGGTRARVFGGQVASQALVAAGRTVPADRRVHSLHAYFMRAGDTASPILYEVERTRDGRSFSTRRVVAIQHGQPIFAMSASFQVDEGGLDHAAQAPAVPAPLTLPTLAQRVAEAEGMGPWGKVPRPFDLRYVTEPPWSAASRDARPGGHSQMWFRADGDLPADSLLHVCLLAYLSDLTLLDAILVNHGIAPKDERLQMASLDHAMWFHRPVTVDQWLLYDINSPSASGSRGMGAGHFFDESGNLLATVMQEGLVRLR